MRPPWGNAIAFYGKDIENRHRTCPTPDMIGARFAVHQGKRWTMEEREITSELGATLYPDIVVPLAPEGFPHGIVATVRCAGFIDTRPDDERVRAGELFDWNPAQFGRGEDRIQRAAVVGASSRPEAARFLDRALSSMWFIGRIGWLLADVRPLQTPIKCNGRQGIYNVSREHLVELKRQGVA